MMKRLAVIPMTIMVMVLMFTNVAFAATDITAAAQKNKAAYASMTQEIASLVNQKRQQAGLAPLTLDDNMCLAASIRSTEMGAYNCFSHTRPSGQSCFTVLDELKIPYGASRENIAYGNTSAQDVMNSWMNSSGHKANILATDVNKIGIGIAADANGRLYFTQLFAGDAVAGQTNNAAASAPTQTIPQSNGYGYNNSYPGYSSYSYYYYGY